MKEKIYLFLSDSRAVPRGGRMQKRSASVVGVDERGKLPNVDITGAKGSECVYTLIAGYWRG